VQKLSDLDEGSTSEVNAAMQRINVGMQRINGSPLGLTTSQAAKALGVSLGTIRRWSDQGYLQSYRTPGGQRRFSQEQIDQFVGSLEQQSVDAIAVRRAG
jgi:excisionase family DNA binding protein